MRSLLPELERRRQVHLYRARRVSEGIQGPELKIDGRSVLGFCSNDYLGLAGHPKVVAAMQEGAAQYGVGSGAAHLVNGHSSAHHQLEEELAEFTRRPRVLLFSTGYMANLGVISGLLGTGDRFYGDRLDHASLIDGGLLSRAGFRRYPHDDVEVLEKWLNRRDDGRVLVASDGVFSMDGDVAPLCGLAKLCSEKDAWLMVDDAHGLGVMGREGRGTLEHLGLGMDDVPILMGTLGKAFGTFGGLRGGIRSAHRDTDTAGTQLYLHHGNAASCGSGHPGKSVAGPRRGVAQRKTQHADCSVSRGCLGAWPASHGFRDTDSADSGRLGTKGTGVES